MSIQVINKSYSGLPVLQANVGDWVDASVSFLSRVDFESSAISPVIYNNFGGVFTLKISGGQSWGELGFTTGSDIRLKTVWTYEVATPIVCPQEYNKQITFISGDTMHLDSAIAPNPSCGGVPPEPNLLDGTLFPNSTEGHSFSAIEIVQKEVPERIRLEFNLSENGTSALESLIDGELNVFETTAVFDETAPSVSMTQINNKSGGCIKGMLLTNDSYNSGGDFYLKYTITFKIFQWVIIQDGFSEPSFYESTGHVAPIFKISEFGKIGNPNSVLSALSNNNEGNTGGFDENFNGGANAFSLNSLTILNIEGDQITGLDYSNPCTFTASIQAPFQDISNSVFNIGLSLRTNDGNLYKNLPDNIGANLSINAPDIDFSHSIAPSPTIYAGSQNSEGVRFDFSELQFFISGSTLTYSGKITPSSQALDFFDAIPQGSRRATMWISIGNHLTDGTSSSERVSLKVFDDQLIDAPTKGVQIPSVISSETFDQCGKVNDPNASIHNSVITTEDSVLYKSDFRLVEGLEYEGVRARISAFDEVDNKEFILEDFYFDFSNTPFVSGIYEVDESVSRGFNLPPSSDRNEISLKREVSNDIVVEYGLRLCYGFLSRWEYWQEQLNADNEFVDLAEPNKGKNKDWQRISDFISEGWKIRVSYFTYLDGVEDFNHHTLKVRPYEDEDVTENITFTRVSDGQVLTNLVDNELIQVEAVLVWNVNDYLNPCAEATIEDLEGGNRWNITTEFNHGNVSSNPLKPISGQTGLSLVTATNTATLTFLVDTNLVSSDKICLSYRIYSDEPFVNEFFVTVTSVFVGGNSGSFNISTSLIDFFAAPIPDGTEATIEICDNADSSKIGEMVFLVGDDLGVAAPQSTTGVGSEIANFMSGTLTNAGIIVFDKLLWAESECLVNDALISEALDLKFKFTLSDGITTSNTDDCDFGINQTSAEYTQLFGLGMYTDDYVFIADRGVNQYKLLNTTNSLTKTIGGETNVIDIAHDENEIINGFPVVYGVLFGGAGLSRNIVRYEFDGKEFVEVILQPVDSAFCITIDQNITVNGRGVIWIGCQAGSTSTPVQDGRILQLSFNGSTYDLVDFDSISLDIITALPSVSTFIADSIIITPNSTIFIAIYRGAGSANAIFRMRLTGVNYNDPNDWSISPVSGGASGNSDGTGSSTSYELVRCFYSLDPLSDNPDFMSWDSLPNIANGRLLTYQSGTDNYSSSKVIAGVSTGDTDGIGSSALLGTVIRSAVSNNGTIGYISDQSNRKIKMITNATNQVTTISGTGVAGNKNEVQY